MKKCPKCLQNYSDKSLDFCLEDGMRLMSAEVALNLAQQTQAKTLVLPTLTNQIDSPNKTEVLTYESNIPASIKEKAIQKGYKTLEISTVIFALSHNYWQWLYVDKPDFANLLSFLISTNFILWFFLLVFGTTTSLGALKYCQNKGFPIVSLVTLAINLILFIVPRR